MSSKNNQAVLLCSGGLDSTTLAYWLQSKNISFIPLFIDYGQHCSTTEYEKLSKVLPPSCVEKIKKINISSVYLDNKSRLISEADLWTDEVHADDMYLPYRNSLLLTVGAAFAQSKEIEKVYTAFINSNHAKEIDCSKGFFDNLANLLVNYGAVKIELPFRNMSKLEVAKIGLRLGAPIAKTFSCQISSKIPCGACPNCVERLNALEALTE